MCALQVAPRIPLSPLHCLRARALGYGIPPVTSQQMRKRTSKPRERFLVIGWTRTRVEGEWLPLRRDRGLGDSNSGRERSKVLLDWQPTILQLRLRQLANR